jgi:hypothetical protein
MTHAYLYTRTAPKNVTIEDNVVVQFAPIEQCGSHPYTDNCGQAIRGDLTAWSQLTNLYIWDYTTDFAHYNLTFPNLNSLRENIRFYAENKVIGVLNQGAYQSISGEFGELRSYLLSKLLCDPYMSEAEFLSHRRDFLVGYYGKGGEEIGRYVDILSEIIDLPDHHIGCFNNPNTLYPIPRFLERLDELQACWDKAEALAETDAERDHIERSKLGFTYSKLLYAFDKICAEGEDQNAAILKENAEFYALLKKYHVRPRGSMSELPELTDMTKNMATEIYWSDIALAMLSPDQL